MICRSHSARHGGFTLIEVLIAIALMMLLSGGLYAFLMDLSQQRQLISHLVESDESASTLIESLERDLSTCIVGTDGLGAGVVGGPSEIQLLSRTVMLSLDGNAQALGDLHGSSYRWSDVSHSLEARKWSVGGEGGSYEVLSDRIERLRFRYFDGTEWVDQFNSMDEARLPPAVEIAIWYFPPGYDPSARETPEDDWLIPPGAEEEFEEFAPEDPQDMEQPDRVWSAPDRLRIIAIPDAAEEQGGSEVGVAS